MNVPTSLISDTIRDPAWLAHRYDDGHDAFHFVEASRALRRKIPFLTDEYLKIADSPRILRRVDSLSVGAGQCPTHFIFHSAYCCSTLLANAFDLSGISTSLKEPQLLNDIVGWRHRGGNPQQLGLLLDSSLRMLERPFEQGESVIIKPSNILNGLANGLMTIRPNARAILLYAPLRAFLASIARKGMWGRLWVRELLSRQLTDGMVNLGFEGRDYLLHTDLQAAAVGWLAQQKLFAEMARKWPDRVRTLNSEVLVANPAKALSVVASFYGLELREEVISGVVASVFALDAKTGSDFAPGQRETDRVSGEALHTEEIDKVAVWAEAVARSADVEMTPPATLLSL